ncbi:MAG: 23S rRNA (adenine(2503)-C(2))-methyltransferase RlmN [Clostridia bacterium]|nr:23S rRNA (adenine(2503)-C(2))-methyltransferase RlmN [Clostridia bacterium]
MDEKGRINLLDLTKNELTELVLSLGEPKYRADQVWGWLLKGCEICEMSNLPAAFREKLSAAARASIPEVADRAESKLDGTVKYLFRLFDGELIESVFMRYEHGNSICISTQAGCRMGCRFCASTIGGKHRDLSPGEMLGQIISVQRDKGERISNIVMMGIGEPLDNYDNSVKFLRLVGSPDGLNVGYRHISLSTCGVVPGIYALAKEDMPITLSISLHASDDAERSELMPVNKRWNIDALMTACRDYFKTTGRRISFEYTLINGKNDTPEKAAALAVLLKKYMGGMPCHVNLIPVNPVAERGFDRSAADRVNAFRDKLTSQGVNATVRRHLGGDIDASCGQLRNRSS